MSNETLYRGYTITYSAGYYWIGALCRGSLQEAKETIDQWEDIDFIND